MNNIRFSSGISEKNCFDFLRFVFAFSVFCSHFAALTSVGIVWPISAGMGVAGFFIISGFLIMRSYYNSPTLGNYTVKRIKRIVPAYYVVVFACAVGLSVVSSLPVAEYFASGTLYKYLAANLTFLNFFQPTLPGVFETNELPVVNASLWTIKVELALYAFVPIVALLLKKMKKTAWLWFFAGLYVISFVFYYGMSHLSVYFDSQLFIILRRQFFSQISYFISGVVLLFYFDWVKNNAKWLVPVALVWVVLKYFTDFWLVYFFFPISFAVLIISFAYYFKTLSGFSKLGDCSYGFYLIHFPVIQLFVHFGWFKENPVLLFIACLLVVLVLSYLLWHVIEKKFLKRR